jgi:hypothetical protein
VSEGGLTRHFGECGADVAANVIQADLADTEFAD